MLKDSEKQNISEFGRSNEELVGKSLQKQGFKILEYNYRKRFGEIDIIASKNELIAFIEVKSRRSHYFNLSEVITKSKQKKIILTAKHYILINNLINKIIRFDVALVEQKNGTLEVNYITNAFTEEIRN